MSNTKERALNSEELAEFTTYHRKGMKLLGVSEDAQPSEIVMAVDAYVDSWQNKRRGFLAKLSPKSGDSVETALSLGIVWGNQIVRSFGWVWSCVLLEGKSRYAVVSPDRSHAIYATYFIKECLDQTTADCTVMLAYNMQIADKLATEAPNEYASVMRSVRRIIPKR